MVCGRDENEEMEPWRRIKRSNLASVCGGTVMRSQHKQHLTDTAEVISVVGKEVSYINGAGPIG
jgi:hypothetical protein